MIKNLIILILIILLNSFPVFAQSEPIERIYSIGDQKFTYYDNEYDKLIHKTVRYSTRIKKIGDKYVKYFAEKYSSINPAIIDFIGNQEVVYRWKKINGKDVIHRIGKDKFIYDKNGKLISIGGKKCEYDNTGKLIKIGDDTVVWQTIKKDNNKPPYSFNIAKNNIKFTIEIPYPYIEEEKQDAIELCTMHTQMDDTQKTYYGYCGIDELTGTFISFVSNKKISEDDKLRLRNEKKYYEKYPERLAKDREVWKNFEEENARKQAVNNIASSAKNNYKAKKNNCEYVSYFGDRIDRIGDRKVYYFGNHIDRIGDEYVSYFGDRIDRIGNRKVYYFGNRIDRICD